MHLGPSPAKDITNVPFNAQKTPSSQTWTPSAGRVASLPSIEGSTYLPAQDIIQQVAYSLSDQLYTYSADSFDLDTALTQWHTEGEHNIWGNRPRLSPMQSRAGAGSAALGYILSPDLDPRKRDVPQTILSSTRGLAYLRTALAQISEQRTSPLVAHIAALDYSPSTFSLVTDYCSAMAVADEAGFAVVTPASVHEVQHMSLLASLMAHVQPTAHIYDGIHTGRETTKFANVLQIDKLRKAYNISSTVSLQQNVEGKLAALLKSLNTELGTQYRPFEYHGHAEPKTVLVVFGAVEASLSAQLVATLAKQGVKVGVVNVRIYRPFIDDAFLQAVPSSVKKVIVLGQVADEAAVESVEMHSKLFADVVAALEFANTSAATVVAEVKYPRGQMWTPGRILDIFRESNVHASAELTDVDESSRKYIFWDLSNSLSASGPTALGEFLSRDSHVSMKTTRDNLVQGGTLRTDIRQSDRPIKAAYAVESADITYVGDDRILGEFDVAKSTRENGTLVLRLPGADDITKNIPVDLRRDIVDKKLSLIILDPQASDIIAQEPRLEPYLTKLAFLKLAQDDLFASGTGKLSTLNGDIQTITAIIAELEKTLRYFDVPESWADAHEEAHVLLPAQPAPNSFFTDQSEAEPVASLRGWQSAARDLLFKEAYQSSATLRPDLGVRTGVVYVKERRRLTPLSYDRNIFHIEFDLRDSGLTYAIGEALGIHAENDEAEVNSFISWYGLKADEVVELESRDDSSMLQHRTVYQTLKQNVDIFGRPPKQFYESLAEFATDPDQKRSLLALSTPEGAVEFKRRAEVDTITFADVLAEFPSARPSFYDLVRLVSPMKRREYSIASSQRVTPNSVSLLIVTVGWVDPHGRDRFGQATRYLNTLTVGAPVTVSIKPSVMKLPNKTTTPIIMAGLGTGLAPFRAFVQERALQKREGHEIGDILLYMGSRHQREEYLYGEEWEAYRDAGVITLLGQAFSRDQPNKIYIQDRMRESLADVRRAYLNREGSFYLCGPTWPVPDVTEVLQQALEEEHQANGGSKRYDSRKEIEKLKDEGRYVLEVY